MGNSIYLGGNIKSAYCGGVVKEMWFGATKLYQNNVVNILGRDYKFVNVGSQVWLAENFAYTEDGLDIVATNDYGIYYRAESLTRIKQLLSGSGWHIATEQDLYDLGCFINGGEPSDESMRYDSSSDRPYFEFPDIDCNDLVSLNDNGNDKYGLNIRKAGIYAEDIESPTPFAVGEYAQIICANADTQKQETDYTSRVYVQPGSSYELSFSDDYGIYASVRLVKD